MKLADYTKLAKDYIYRAGYSEIVLKVLAHHVEAFRNGFKVADVGAGTGKLTELLISMGLSGFAIEPNDSMREEGLKSSTNTNQFVWMEGSAEETRLSGSSIDWVIMASSFHWTNQEISLKEFYRILKPGGFFTAMWNPRDIENNEFYKNIEKKIYEIVPDIQRVSSGSEKYTKDLGNTLLSHGNFCNLLFVESPHEVVMEKERYIGVWKSVNDIQAQAGEAKFQEILDMISLEVSGLDKIVVPYKTRAWTVKSKKK